MHQRFEQVAQNLSSYRSLADYKLQLTDGADRSDHVE